jgi:hypothetical protein
VPLYRCEPVRAKALSQAFIPPEQIKFDKLYLLCKDLSSNPCHEMLVGWPGAQALCFASRASAVSESASATDEDSAAKQAFQSYFDLVIFLLK